MELDDDPRSDIPVHAAEVIEQPLVLGRVLLVIRRPEQERSIMYSCPILGITESELEQIVELDLNPNASLAALFHTGSLNRVAAFLASRSSHIRGDGDHVGRAIVEGVEEWLAAVALCEGHGVP